MSWSSCHLYLLFSHQGYYISLTNYDQMLSFKYYRMFMISREILSIIHQCLLAILRGINDTFWMFRTQFIDAVDMVKMRMREQKSFYHLPLRDSLLCPLIITYIHQPTIIKVFVEHDVRVRREDSVDYLFYLQHLIHCGEDVAHCLESANLLTGKFLTTFFIEEDNQ